MTVCHINKAADVAVVVDQHGVKAPLLLVQNTFFSPKKEFQHFHYSVIQAPTYRVSEEVECDVSQLSLQPRQQQQQQRTGVCVFFF